MKAEEWRSFINSAMGLAALGQLYGRWPEVLRQQQARYCALVDQFCALYPGESGLDLFSSPGRTEVGGNHTDHNGGRVLAAAVDLDVIAAVSKTDDGLITLNSEGYPPLVVDTRQLAAVPAERTSSAGLVRGICARLAELKRSVGGFKACLTSRVPNGAGLSSSAAFELMLGVIFNELYNDGKIPPLLLAQVGQYAENVYFGKPSGLMDQTTIAVGGFVTIDFKDFAAPLVRKVKYDFTSSGYLLVIVETGGDHAGLTEEYASIANEMKAVAQALGGKLLRDVPPARLQANLPALRRQLGDRAILRAMHFFGDDLRVVDQVQALEQGKFTRFLDLVNESGRSSWMLLQNCYTTRQPAQQGISLGLALSEQKLRSRGAWRVHGGGFAGTIQVFLPSDQVADYVAAMDAVFGKGACHPVLVRQAGAARIVTR